MEEYQKRVIAEKKELNERIVKLTSFIFSDKNNDLETYDANVLNDQLSIMMEYSAVLKERIKDFQLID